MQREHGDDDDDDGDDGDDGGGCDAGASGVADDEAHSLPGS